MNKKARIIYGCIVFSLTVSGFLGIRIFDITIFGGEESKLTIQTPSKSQQPVKKMSYRALQPENVPPFARVKRLPETRTSSHPAEADSVKTLEFSRLMVILKGPAEQF